MIHMVEKSMELSLDKKRYLEDRIRDMINELYNVVYIAPLKVNYSDGIYTLKVGLNGIEVSQLSLGFGGNEDEFLKFIKKELRKRKLHSISSNQTTLINGDAPMHYPIIEL